MEAVCVCGGCGRTIKSEFLYCPWCGQEKKHSREDVLETVFKQLEKKQAEGRAKRLAELEKKLDDLEQDLSVLALSAEMAK